jgi:glycosyltransferase involved in cell wall biosynthesis
MKSLAIMLPVYNEAPTLKRSIASLQPFLSDPILTSNAQVKVVLVDNASTDDTSQIGAELADEYDNVEYLRLEHKGRGYALKTAWLQSDADVVAYMDIDLSTSLAHLNDLVLPLLNDEADIVFGSRLSKNSSVTGRSLTREVLSRGYNKLLKFFMAADFKDAQCGFKAIRRDVFEKLAPNIKDKEWFFDTELLLQSEYNKYRMLELPVVWVDDPDSKVKLARTVRADLKGMARVYRKEKPYAPFHRLFSFGVIGLITTVGYGVMYYLLTRVLHPQLAILLTLSAMTLINVSLNRHFTYRKTTSADISIHYIVGVTAFLLSWAISGGGLYVIEKIHGPFSAVHETFIVVGLSLVGTVIKYVLFHIGFHHTPKSKTMKVVKTADLTKEQV